MVLTHDEHIIFIYLNKYTKTNREEVYFTGVEESELVFLPRTN